MIDPPRPWYQGPYGPWPLPPSEEHILWACYAAFVVWAAVFYWFVIRVIRRP